MARTKSLSRRTALKTGLAGISAAALSSSASSEEIGAVKKPGRIKVVAIMGDYWHNPVWLEVNIERIFKKMDWDVYFTSCSDALTPKLLSDTDLFIAQRYGGRDPLGFVPKRLVNINERPPGADYITTEQEDAVIDNIKNRGMSYLSLHCSFWNQPPKIREMLGVEQGMHPVVQPVWIRKFNPVHPITKGMEQFVEEDEQFFVKMKNPNHTILFHNTGCRDQRESIAGWCFEYGKGRVAALLPGHTAFVWQHPGFQQLVLRSSLWLLHRDIPSNVAELAGRQKVSKKPVGGVGKPGVSYFDGFE